MNWKQRAATVLGAGVLGLAWPMISYWEGLKFTPYKDIGGIVTACRGNTKNIRLGHTYTKEECDELDSKALVQHFEGMMQCVRVPLTDAQSAAFLSLAYNIGVGNFCRSTLVKKLNTKDYPGACAQILRWDRAGGRQVKGLVNRRTAEYKLCMGAR